MATEYWFHNGQVYDSDPTASVIAGGGSIPFNLTAVITISAVVAYAIAMVMDKPGVAALIFGFLAGILFMEAFHAGI